MVRLGDKAMMHYIQECQEMGLDRPTALKYLRGCGYICTRTRWNKLWNT